jgi:hypothetical protein
VRAAVARAVEHVLSSKEALELLVRRLEAAGWHIEQAPGAAHSTPEEPAPLTPPTRAR